MAWSSDATTENEAMKFLKYCATPMEFLTLEEIRRNKIFISNQRALDMDLDDHELPTQLLYQLYCNYIFL